MGHFVIFGATGRIGSKLAEILTAQKHQITLATRSKEKGMALAQKLRQDYHIVDYSNSSSIQQGLEQIVAKFGDVDGIANCIGTLYLKPLHLTSDEEWHTILTANLTYAFYILKAACPYFEKRKKGAIVLLTSAAAQLGLADHEAISAAKAGLVGLMRSAAASYAQAHVRINVAAPGFTDTPPNLQSNLALPEDMAHAISWLLSEEASSITGQVLSVDGDLSTSKTHPQK